MADSLKVKSIREQAKDLAYCGLKIVSVISFDATYFNAWWWYIYTISMKWRCTVFLLLKGGCCWEVGTHFHRSNMGQSSESTFAISLLCQLEHCMCQVLLCGRAGWGVQSVECTAVPSVCHSWGGCRKCSEYAASSENKYWYLNRFVLVYCLLAGVCSFRILLTWVVYCV